MVTATETYSDICRECFLLLQQQQLQHLHQVFLKYTIISLNMLKFKIALEDNYA